MARQSLCTRLSVKCKPAAAAGKTIKWAVEYVENIWLTA